MRRTNPKQFAAALRACAHGKKKHDSEAMARSLVLRFGMLGKLKFLMRVQHALTEFLDAEKGIQRVVARVPSCDEKKAKVLFAAMTKHMKCHTELSFVDAPSLIAGAVFTVGDKRYDGSIKARLRQLQKNLI